MRIRLRFRLGLAVEAHRLDDEVQTPVPAVAGGDVDGRRTTLVVSPLIALMLDQVEALRVELR